MNKFLRNEDLFAQLFQPTNNTSDTDRFYRMKIVPNKVPATKVCQML